MTTTWTGAAPADTTPDSYQLTGQVGYESANGDGTTTPIHQVAVPYDSLNGAVNDPGISDDASPTFGNIDGAGRSYSAPALATTGLTPGASSSHGGLSFTWPNVQPGMSDNVAAGGQTIALSGSGSLLGFLGTGDYGSASGRGTIFYTDGSAQTFGLSFADWWANEATTGGEILATMPYINTSTGRRNQTASIYYASVPLEQGKTVQYVTLPDVSRQPAANQVAMHIFAIAIG